MIKTRLFKHTFALLFIISVLNLIATIFYLHWTTWWFAAGLHFLSGFVIAMITILFIQHFYNITAFKLLKIILITVIASFIVGVLWEVYELYFGITFLSDGMVYVVDTASDLIMNICGSFFGVLYARKFLQN